MPSDDYFLVKDPHQPVVDNSLYGLRIRRGLVIGGFYEAWQVAQASVEALEARAGLTRDDVWFIDTWMLGRSAADWPSRRDMSGLVAWPVRSERPAGLPEELRTPPSLLRVPCQDIDAPIRELDLSVRTETRMRAAGIHTLRDFATTPMPQLARFKILTRRCIYCILQPLIDVGLEFDIPPQMLIVPPGAAP